MWKEKRINILVSKVNQSWPLFNGLLSKIFLDLREETGEYLFMRELNHKKMLFCGQKESNIINFMWSNLIKNV